MERRCRSRSVCNLGTVQGGVGLRIIKMRSYEPRQQNNKSERKPFQNDDRREYAGSPWAASWRLSFDLREHFQTRLKMLS